MLRTCSQLSHYSLSLGFREIRDLITISMSVYSNHKVNNSSCVDSVRLEDFPFFSSENCVGPTEASLQDWPPTC